MPGWHAVSSLLLGGIAAAAVACSAPDPNARTQDPYQACLEHYSMGDVGPYDAPSLQRAFPTDRSDHQSRMSWSRSPQDRCNDLRTRGRL